MDKARKAYGFKYDASFIKALSLFKDEDKEQLHKRYFKDFYAYKENVLIRKFVNKEELKEHCKMEDILHQYFSIDKILNFIKKEKLNNNISSTIKRDLVTINSIYKKNAINSPIKTFMNEQKIYTRDDLINNVDEYIKQIEQHTNQRQVEGINQIQHISNNTDTFTRSENQPQNVLFNQQNMLQFVNPPTVSQGQSEGYQTECPVLNNPMIINGLTQQIVQIIDPIAITVVPQDDQTLYTVSFLYPNNTVKTAQNVKFSDPNTGESIIVAPGTYNIYCSEGQVYFLNVQKLQIPIEPASTSTIYNNPVNNIDTRNTFLNAQRTNEFNGQNMGQYYNSNQNNFMNYNNHQGF